MRPEEIPQELIDILDNNAGKKHSKKGTVVTTLAEILTRYDEMKAGKNCACVWGNQRALEYTQERH